METVATTPSEKRAAHEAEVKDAEFAAWQRHEKRLADLDANIVRASQEVKDAAIALEAALVAERQADAAHDAAAAEHRALVLASAPKADRKKSRETLLDAEEVQTMARHAARQAERCNTGASRGVELAHDARRRELLAEGKRRGFSILRKRAELLRQVERLATDAASVLARDILPNQGEIPMTPGMPTAPRPWIMSLDDLERERILADGHHVPEPGSAQHVEWSMKLLANRSPPAVIRPPNAVEPNIQGGFQTITAEQLRAEAAATFAKQAEAAQEPIVGPPPTW